MDEFTERTARIQQSVHTTAGWDHSVLIIVRPGVGEAAVFHVDEHGRAWGGATRVAGQIARLGRAIEAVRSDDERDITDLARAFAPQGDERMDIAEVMGGIVHISATGAGAPTVALVVRDADEPVSLTARLTDGRIAFVEEPFGHTDALIADAAAYADIPMAGNRSSAKSALRLSRPAVMDDLPRVPSALTRYLRLEEPHLVPLLDSIDAELAAQDPQVQVSAWLWARIVDRLAEISGEQFDVDVRPLLDELAEQQKDYQPVAIDDGENPIGPVVSAFIGGVWEDVCDRQPPRMGELLTASARAAVNFNASSSRWGLAYDSSLGQVFLVSLLERHPDDMDMVVLLAPLVQDVQRLWWIGECLHRRGIVLASGHAPAFPADEMECVRLLCRIAANQPTLACAVDLHRQVPLRADRWMSLTGRSHRALDELELASDQHLSARLADEVLHDRRFVLDHIAIVEIDELGIDRIVLTPEQRSEVGSSVTVFVLVEHQRGAFVVSSSIAGDDDPYRDESDESRTLTFAPAFMTERTIEEGTSPLELLVISAWRDLVVADVREQQYTTEVVRKTKGKRRQGRGGEVIRYLPRRVAARRAEQTARAASGEPTLRRLFAVGAYAKRLPAGQQRSAEAQAFAAEIGIPLADHQTVVRPHWRGGTQADRDAAAQAPDAPTRTWRSWSALDLLRTRRSQPTS